MTLDKIAKQVESLRAEVAELTARPPSIVVNRGDEIAVTGLDLLKSQVLLKDDWGATVTASAPDQAAEEAGRRYDQNGDYLLMQGNEIVVHVLAPDGKKYSFEVRGESVPEYYAKEKRNMP